VVFIINRSNGMAENSTSHMQDRELFAAMAMQALVTRAAAPADVVAKQAVAYANALIQALEAIAPKASDLSGDAGQSKNSEAP
jgi:hypothetical protein